MCHLKEEAAIGKEVLPYSKNRKFQSYNHTKTVRQKRIGITRTKGNITWTKPEKVLNVSPSKTGVSTFYTYRMILNLIPFNNDLQYHFKMDSEYEATSEVCPGSER